MINFGIVGCGHIAKKHVDGISAVEGARLKAVCDVSEERLNAFTTDEVAGFTRLSDMLPKVDVVCICTPSGLHADLAVQAAKAGKHVIVEKPMALTLSDADIIIRSCQENNVKLAVVHPNRFRPAIMALREQMDQQAFGKIGHASAVVRWNRNQAYYDQAPWRGTVEMDGGVLMNQAIHNIDLLLWMMGPVEEVFSYQATRLRQIEAEDTSISTLRFVNGALGSLEAATTIYPKNLEESLSIFGEKGTAVIGGPTANWIHEWKFEGMSEEEAQRSVEEINKDPFGIPGHQHIIQDMVLAIQDDRRPVVSGEEGRQALALVIACTESAQKNQPVQLKDLPSI